MVKWISKFWCIHRVKYHISYLNKLHTLTWALQCFTGFPDSSVGKESTCNAGDPGSIPGSGRSAGEGIGYPLQYSWASLVAHVGDLGSIPGLGRFPGEGKGYPLQYFGLENSTDSIVWHIPCGSNGKASACNVGDPGLIPGLGRTPGEGNGNPLQYSCLENSTDGGA